MVDTESVRETVHSMDGVAEVEVSQDKFTTEFDVYLEKDIDSVQEIKMQIAEKTELTSKHSYTEPKSPYRTVLNFTL